MRIIYLHGFASSPKSKKAQFFQQKLGIRLETVDLNLPDFSTLLVSQQIERLTELIAGDKVILIGSSFGGLMSLFLAENLQNVTKIILLAPALGINQLWEKMVGRSVMDTWQGQRKVKFYHYGYGEEVELHYSFIEDLRNLPDIQFTRQLPALVFHGENDQTIPFANAIKYAQCNHHAIVSILDDEHSLESSLEAIWRDVEPFIG